MLAGCWSWTSWCFICWLKVDESTTCWFEIRKLRCHGGLTSNLACCTRVCNFKGWLNHNKGLDHRLDSSRCPCPASSWLVYCWILSASVVFPCIVTNFSPFHGGEIRFLVLLVCHLGMRALVFWSIVGICKACLQMQMQNLVIKGFPGIGCRWNNSR